jgi:hypothetical protein
LRPDCSPGDNFGNLQESITANPGVADRYSPKKAADAVALVPSREVGYV